jgi:hypothetical protein
MMTCFPGDARQNVVIVPTAQSRRSAHLLYVSGLATRKCPMYRRKTHSFCVEVFLSDQWSSDEVHSFVASRMYQILFSRAICSQFWLHAFCAKCCVLGQSAHNFGCTHPMPNVVFSGNMLTDFSSAGIVCWIMCPASNVLTNEIKTLCFHVFSRILFSLSHCFEDYVQ